MDSLQDTLIPYEDMLKAGMHFGRKRTVFHPAMKPYVFIIRDGVCIIDLLKTQEQLGAAIAFLKETLARNGLILFVAPTKQSQESMKALAEALGMPYVMDRWLGGTLTNFKVIIGRVKRLEELERKLATGELDKYTKKERLGFERELAKLKVHFDGLRKLTRIPDVLFVSSVKEGSLPISEATATGVKVVGIVNTDADPHVAHVAIPSNDRSKVSLDLILSLLTKELTAVRQATSPNDAVEQAPAVK